MKIRISVATPLFSLILVFGLFSILFVTNYANRQLRVGGPLYNQIKLGNDLVADILPPPEYVVEAYLEATLAVRNPSELSVHKRRLAELHRDYDERRTVWIKSDLDEKLKRKLTGKSDAEVQRFWSVTENELLPALAQNDGPGAEKAYAKLDAVYAAHRAIIDEIVKQANNENFALEVSAADQVTMYSTIVWAIASLVTFIVGLGILGMTIGVVRPLARLTAAMVQVAKGDLNTLIPGTARSDEIGDMARAIGTIRSDAENKAREEAEARLKQDRAAVEEHKRELSKFADDFEGATGTIIQAVSSASTELESAAAALMTTAGHSQKIVSAGTEASENAASNVQSVASATQEMASSIHEISRQVQQSSQIAIDAVAQAQRTNERVAELSKAASRIGDVVDLINTIASQTNLLALNATIEAARAGDAGRGFAVVASEVKSLAEQTAKATGEIGQQINSIHSAMNDSVVAIKDISATIGKMSEISATIASAVEEQGAATQEISRSIQHAAEGTRKVRTNIGDVQRGASETSSASSQVLSSARLLSKESSRLRAEVEKFLQTVRAA
jgi:methyl-accepting chemotaxis protein